MPDFAEQIIRESDYARSLRAQWDTLWQDLARYEWPSMANFTTQRSPGTRRGVELVNSAGKLASRECAVRVNGFLTAEGTSWFDLRIPDPRLERSPVVRGWLDQVKRIAYAVFNSPGSGFGTSKEPTYRQDVVFGNAPLFIGESPDGWPVYRSVYLGNCAIWTDDDSRPVAVFREYEQTAWGLMTQFGKAGLPQEVASALDREPQKKFRCIHAVRPRMEGDPFDIAAKPFVEAYILKDKKALLGPPGGYWELPYIFSRWNVNPEEMYGRGPGEDALSDVKMLQKMDRDLAQHVEMNVNPQWLSNDEAGTSTRINQGPGKIIYAPQDPRGNWAVQPVGPTGRADEAMDMRADTIRTVKALFYLDAFRMVEKITESGSVVHMSATEFAGRQADQFRFAGPALERLRAEHLFPLLARTVAILIRNRKVPPPPPQLRGVPVHPEYVSPLAVAQRAQDGTAVLQWINDLIPLAQIDQRALDIVNVPAAGRVLGRSRHVLQEVMNSPAEIAAIREARAQAAQEQARMEQLESGASAAKDSAQALQLTRGGAA